MLKKNWEQVIEKRSEQIKENPYLQYFIGFKSYQQEPPVDASLLVYFRKRIDIELVNKINEKIVKSSQERAYEEVKKKIQIQKKEKNKPIKVN